MVDVLPPLVECNSTCSACDCATASLFDLLNSKVPDDLSVLRQQLAMSQQLLARSAKECDSLRTDRDRLAAARDTIGRAARRRATHAIYAGCRRQGYSTQAYSRESTSSVCIAFGV